MNGHDTPHLTAGFIGLGLIGGSIARGLKRADPQTRIMAYMRSRDKLLRAREDGIVDVVLDGVGPELLGCDIIYLCTPVEYNAQYLRELRPFVGEGAVVTDVSSTKEQILRTVEELGMESCFVGGHPMAGSEKTGYENSTDHLLENAYYIVAPTARTPQALTDRVIRAAEMIRAIPLTLDASRHDRIVAAISHLPHLIASALVNLVHDSDDEDQMMKRLAAGGFKDITRIASSSPVMWEQICMTNTDNILEMLNRYIDSLSRVRADLESRTEGAVFDMMTASRDYRNSFAERRGVLAPEYSFSADVVDKPGAISIVSSILAVEGINIKNIGINHNREHGEGAMDISFYDDESMERAYRALEGFNFKLFRR